MIYSCIEGHYVNGTFETINTWQTICGGKKDSFKNLLEKKLPYGFLHSFLSYKLV